MTSKFKKVLASFLILSFVFTGTVFANNTTDNDKQKTGKTTKEQSEEKEDNAKSVLEARATALGTDNGKIKAERDYRSNKTSDPNRYFSDADKNVICEEIGLPNSSDPKVQKLRDICFETFMDAYRLTYTSTYLDMKARYGDAGMRGLLYEMAKKAAELDGKVYAYNDFIHEKGKNPDRALNESLRTESLRKRFALDSFGKSVTGDFNQDYRDVFKLSYKINYAQAARKRQDNNQNFIHVDANPFKIEFDTSNVGAKAAVASSSRYPKVVLTGAAGTIRRDALIAIINRRTDDRFKNSNYTPLSPIYGVIVKSKSNGGSVLSLERPLEFAIMGYPVPQAGIYMYDKGNWQYMYTTMEVGKIKCQIPNGYYSGKDYAVMVDNSFVPPKDIAYHAFYSTLYTAARRHILQESPYIRPTEKMTRGELADMIYRIMKNQKSVAFSKKLPSDAKNSAYAGGIRYVLNAGYMNNINGMFKPNQKVSYLEFQNIFKKLTPNQWFNMSYLASKLRSEYYLSDYTSGRSKYISREEAIYAAVNLLY